MRTCMCILAGTKTCEKCQNNNNNSMVFTWTGGGWTWKKHKNDKTITTTKKNNKMDNYEYLCLFIDYLKQKGIVSLAMFDDDAYLKLKRDIEDFVNEDYNLNSNLECYIYERIKRAWKNKYGERWE